MDAPASYWEALSSTAETCLFRVIPWEDFLKLSQSRTLLSSDPLTWSGFAANPKLVKCPTLGQDSYSVVRGLGYSNDQISSLMGQGVLVQKTV
jgi:crotonobetainyl-CoA:carnitine CoA-transferase CaiB-like acyl-CoA transferase